MSAPKQGARSGAVILAIGQASGYALSFVRNLILARCLAKADYGVAAAFSLATGSFEIIGRMALGQQVVQCKEEDLDGILKNTQTLQICGALVSAVLLAAFCQPVAQALKAPQLAWAFGTLGLIPLAMGMENLGIYRFQRALRFGPGVACELVPQILTTLAAWPLVLWLGDYRVILILVLGKSFASTLMTNLLSEHRYSLSFDRSVFRKIISFSWPMVASSFLMFASQQADQMLVAAKFSLEKLAAYSAPFAILMVPWVLFARVLGPVMLSVMSRVQSFREQFEQNYVRCAELSAFATVVLTVPLLVGGEQIVTMFFGPKYAGCGTVMAILVGANAFRFLKSAPTVAAMAMGDTKNQLVACALRCTSIPVALIAIAMNAGFEWIAFAALIGEMFSLIAAVWMIARRQGLSPMLFSRSIVFTVASLGTGAMVHIFAVKWPFIPAMSAAMIVVSVEALVGIALFPSVQAYTIRPMARRFCATEKMRAWAS